MTTINHNLVDDLAINLVDDLARGLIVRGYKSHEPVDISQGWLALANSPSHGTLWVNKRDQLFYIVPSKY